jgi:hypothetical protein
VEFKMADLNEQLGNSISSEIDSHDDVISRHGGVGILTDLVDGLSEGEINEGEERTNNQTDQNFENEQSQFENTELEYTNEFEIDAQTIQELDSLINDADLIDTIVTDIAINQEEALEELEGTIRELNELGQEETVRDPNIPEVDVTDINLNAQLNNENPTLQDTQAIETLDNIDETPLDISTAADQNVFSQSTTGTLNIIDNGVKEETPDTKIDSLTSDLADSSDTGVSDSDDLTNDSTPTITGTTEPNATVVITDEDGNEIGSAIADENGEYSITTSVLDEGSHDLTITVTDEAGNSASATQNVTIDTQIDTPQADLADSSDTGVSDSDDLTNDSTPIITGTTEPNATVVITDEDGNEIGSAIADENGEYSITTSVLDEGSHDLTITVTDEAGNSASATQNVIIDTVTTSSVNISDESNDDVINNLEKTTSDISGDVEAGSIINSISVTDGLNTVAVDSNDIILNSDGSFSVENVDLSSLEDGELTLVVISTDPAGNTVSSQDTIFKDTSSDVDNNLTMRITTSDEDTNDLEVGHVSTTLSGVDADAASVEITFSDGTNSITVTALNDGNGNWSIEDTDLSTLSDGNITVNAIVTDIAGNTTTLNDSLVLDTSINDIPETNTEPVLVSDDEHTINISKEYIAEGETPSTNLIITLDVSGSMVKSAFGGVIELEDGSKTTRFELAKEALINTIESYDLQGDVDVNLTLFGVDDLNIGWMNAEEALNYLNNLTMPAEQDNVYLDGNRVNVNTGGTDFYDALDGTLKTDFTDHNADNNVAIFISDGEPNSNANFVNSENDQMIQDWKEFVENNNIDLNVIGIGTNISTTYLDVIQVQEGESAVIVSDETQLNQILINSTGEEISGNIVESSNVDFGDSEFGEVVSIQIGDTSYNVDTFPVSGLTTPEGGILTINFETGDYTYVALPGSYDEDASESFTLTVADREGDTVDVDLNINIDVTITNIPTAPDAPVITSITDTEDNDISTVIISGTAEANSSIEVFNGGTSLGTVLTDSEGNWNIDVDFADGINNVTAVATMNGLTGDASTISTISINNGSVDLNNTSVDYVASESTNMNVNTSGGDDTIVGGTGNDTVNLNGPRENYEITLNEDGSIKVNDIVGNDGVDTLHNIETISFTDGEFNINQLLDLKAEAPTLDMNISDVSETTTSNNFTDTGNSNVNFNNDSEIGTDSSDSYEYKNINQSNFDTKDGGDTIQVSSNANNASIQMGTGDDKVAIAGNSEYISIDTKEGNDDVYIGGNFKQASIQAGEGDDVIQLDGNIGNSNVQFGDGNDVLVLGGSQSDYNIFNNGGGNYSIQTSHGWTSVQSVEAIVFEGDGSFIGDASLAQNYLGSEIFEYEIDLNAGLSDTDGSESLSDITLDNVPSGATILDSNENIISPNVDGSYTIPIDSNGDAVVTLQSSSEIQEDSLNEIIAKVSSLEVSSSDTSEVAVTNDSGLEAVGTIEDDQFTFGDNDMDLNFSNLEPIDLDKEINILDMRIGSHELNSINVNDVMDMTGSDNTLKILGNTSDSLSLGDNMWEKGNSTVDEDGKEYVVYTGYGDNNEEIQLLIDSTVNITEV